MARNVKLAYCKCLDYDVRNFIQKGSEYYDEPWMALFSWLNFGSRLDNILSYGCESKEEVDRVYKEAYRLFFNKRHAILESLDENLRYIVTERLGLDGSGKVRTLKDISEELGISSSMASKLFENAVELIAYKNHYCYLDGMLFDEDGLNEYLQSKDSDSNSNLYRYKFSDELEYKVAKYLMFVDIHSFSQIRDVIFEKCGGCPATEEEVIDALIRIRRIGVNYAKYLVGVMKDIGILELVLKQRGIG